MTVTGHTRCFAVLGSPIQHTLSPLMHNAAFEQLGMDAIYVPFEVRKSDLPTVLPGLQCMGFGGVNLTIPLKECAFANIDALDESARRLGAVNTISFAGGPPRGYNTDGEGFLRDLDEQADLQPNGLSLLVMGCGGAGRAIAITCADQGASKITLFNRTPARAVEVARVIKDRYPECVLSIVSGETSSGLKRAAFASDLIVQCTSLGMHPDDPPLLGSEAFRAGQVFYDLVYVRPKTPTMTTAINSGAHAVNGLGMLLHQGAASFRIWTGTEPDVARMRRVLERKLYE